HGELDSDVPLPVACRLLQQLHSADVQLTIVKAGGHRLSQPHEIDAILHTVAGLLEPLVTKDAAARR
ncbi:MAG: alpha/beta hydrolase, partial [Sphingomonas sp.]|nr:alpha/beta hydrolase [Sphingomonas sp.]